jgi:hypothetical protein
MLQHRLQKVLGGPVPVSIIQTVIWRLRSWPCGYHTSVTCFLLVLFFPFGGDNTRLWTPTHSSLVSTLIENDSWFGVINELVGVAPLVEPDVQRC